jgi:hypothetical protein
MKPDSSQFGNVVDLAQFRARKEGMSAPGPNHPAAKALQRKTQLTENLNKVEKQTKLFNWKEEGLD